MVYAGVENMTLGRDEYFSIPMQNVLMHYKSQNLSRDVVMASTFLMLMAFDETGGTECVGSPDYSDSLWASFSLSFNFSHYFPNLHLPSPDIKVDAFPLTGSSDKLEWTCARHFRKTVAIQFSMISDSSSSWPK